MTNRLELDFRPGSRVDGLYWDMREDFLKRGGTEDEFISIVNSGYPVHLMLKLHRNDLSKIERPEVLKIAYQFKEFHQYLAKYNYPLPMGMNDYNSKTRADRKIKQGVDKDMAGLIREVQKEGLKEGTAEYVIELARRVYDWGLTKMSSFSDCDIEAEDWRVLKKKCGLCTEQSAVMHYALQRAGLKPEFAFLHRHKPTIENFDKFGGLKGDKNTVEWHICTGIPVPGRKGLLYIDTTLKAFDARYERAETMAPGQFVVGITGNKISNIQSDAASNIRDALKLSTVCVELGDAISYLTKYAMLRKLQMMENLDEIEGKQGFEEVADGIKKGLATKRPEFIVLNLGIGLIEGVLAGEQEKIAQILANISGLAGYYKENYPEDAASLLFNTVDMLRQVANIYRNIPGDIASHFEIDFSLAANLVDRHIYNILSQIVVLDPGIMPAHSLLMLYTGNLSQAEPDYMERTYELYRKLTETDPGMALAHYIRASYALRIASMNAASEAAPYFKDVEAALSEAERLEPGNIGVRSLGCQLALLKRDYDSAMKIIESAKDSSIGSIGEIFYAEKLLTYMAQNELEKARSVADEMLAKDPRKGRTAIMNTIGSLLANSTSKLPDAESETRAVFSYSNGGLLAFMEDLLDIAAEDKTLEEDAKQLYGRLYMLAIFGENNDIEKSAGRKMGRPPSSDVKKAIDNTLENGVDCYFKADMDRLYKISMEEDTEDSTQQNDFGKRLLDFAGMLLPTAEYPGYSKVFITSAKSSIIRNNSKPAAELLKRHKDVAHIAELYFENVVKEIFSWYIADERSAVRFKMFLDAIEASLVFDPEAAGKMFEAEKSALGTLLEKISQFGFDPALNNRAAELYEKLNKVNK